MRLWGHFPKLRHKQFYLLLALMIFASITEIISIGAVIPFLAILTAPDLVYQHDLMQPIKSIFNLTAPDQLLLPLTIFFALAALLAGSIRLALLFVMTRLSYAVGADLSIDIYNRTLYQDYIVHVSRNSSQVINGVITKTGTVISGVVVPILTIMSSVLIIAAILSTLFLVDAALAIMTLLGFSLLYIGVFTYAKKQLSENSKTIADQSTQMIKSLQEGLGGIRDVLIDGSQEFYCKLYRNADIDMRRASANNSFISNSPRYVVEAIGMSLIAGFAYYMSLREGGLNTAIPVLGALALGAQRLLPALQQAYGGYTQLKGSYSSLEDILELLDQPLPEYASKDELASMPFNSEISLNNLSFRYTVDSNENVPWIIKNINLKIMKGQRVGFMGETGVGKSTLLDIIMGLLSPTSGEIEVDGQSIINQNRRTWQKQIAHVPQAIYLSDSSIEENIAFGISKEMIDHQKVKKAAKHAQIAEFIEGWKDGYQTFVGERGIKLSGGQRQRIGIARALYKNANVLIFDEATSALDNQTEREVMEAIEMLGKNYTILIIAHRLTTLKNCDSIIKLDKDNKIIIGSYKEMTNSNNEYLT